MLRITSRSTIISKPLINSKMPAFTLYGFHGSTATDRVRLTLAEGGFTDFGYVLVNLPKGDQKVSDFWPRRTMGGYLVLHLFNEIVLVSDHDQAGITNQRTVQYYPIFLVQGFSYSSLV